MRLSVPRIEPIQDADLTEEQRLAVAPAMVNRPLLNIYRTLAHAPEALTAFLRWGGYVFSRQNSLAPRQRELVILRVGFLCRSGYEFTQHTAHGLRAGLTDAEIQAVKAGALDPAWDPADTSLIRAADELVSDHFVSDRTWETLGRHFSRKQCMDLVFTVGQYVLVSMSLNTFGVQLDTGQALDDDLKSAGG